MVGRVSAASLGAVVLLGLTWWAGRASLVSTLPDTGPVEETVFATVTDGTVGESLRFNASVTRPFDDVATNMLSGVVTSVNPQTTLSVGDVLLTVDGISVRVVAGSYPFYRDLGLGTEGQDVMTLQNALQAMGLYGSEPDGVFGPRTEAALRRWETARGDPATGIVPLGTLVAIPTLPSPVRLNDDIAVGTLVAGGELLASVPAGALEFSLSLTPEQAARIPEGTAVSVVFGEHRWDAVVTGRRDDDSGSPVLLLAAETGELVCGEECAALPPSESLVLEALVHIVPEVSGPAVPLAAVHTDTFGQAFVYRQDGERVDVRVRGSGSGVAVIDGLDPGDIVSLTAPVGEPDVGDQ